MFKDVTWSTFVPGSSKELAPVTWAALGGFLVGGSLIRPVSGDTFTLVELAFLVIGAGLIWAGYNALKTESK